jgi:hypothetical protein
VKSNAFEEGNADLLKKERKRRDEEFLVGERKGLKSNSRLANWQLKFIFRKINGYYLTLPRAAWPVDAMTSLRTHGNQGRYLSGCNLG